jgi:prepilin-type processing-associated H-X9-DG protein
VVIGIICVLLSVVLSWMERMRETSGRLPCPSNLRQIGQALLLYSQDYHGEFPRTLYDPSKMATTAYTNCYAPNPFGPGGPTANDVTAAYFLVLRTQDLNVRTFVCPTIGREYRLIPDEVARAAAKWSNFPDRGYLSYSFLSPYSPHFDRDAKPFTNPGRLDETIVVASDMSPGLAAEQGLSASSSAEAMRKGNSPNHEGDGQNVLYGDGHVSFENNPFIGPGQANIFSGASVPDSSVSRPSGTADFVDVLLPGFKDGPTPTPAGLSDNVRRSWDPVFAVAIGLVVGIVLFFWMLTVGFRWARRRAYAPSKSGH